MIQLGAHNSAGPLIIQLGSHNSAHLVTEYDVKARENKARITDSGVLWLV